MLHMCVIIVSETRRRRDIKIPLCLSDTCSEKFNIVSNERPWTHAKVLFFYFLLEIPFLGKFGPKTPNCQFKLKFSIQINSNMQNFMVMFTFLAFDWKYIFLGKFGPKNQNCQFGLKFGTQINLNMQNSMVCCSLFLLQTRYTLFRQIWFKKSKLSVKAWNYNTNNIIRTYYLLQFHGLS